MAAEGKREKKRGPKGGIKHQSGRDHDRKGAPKKKKRFARKAAQKHQQKSDDAKKAWRAWDALPDDVKRLLGPAGQPTMPRPSDD